MMRLAMAILLGLPVAPLAAQTSAPACPAMPAPPPIGLAGWSSPSAAVASPAIAAAPAIAIGTAYRLALQPAAKIALPVAPKHGGAAGYGGMVRIVVSVAATYRVALGSGAWIDVVADGKALDSTGHAHGPDCTGIRKMVDYALTPGSYLVSLAANRDPAITAMVVRLP